MAQQWMAIEERVPGNDGAVRQHAPSADAPSRRSRIVESIIAAVEEEQRAPIWLVAPSRRVARQWIDAVALGGLPVFNVRATTPRALCYDIAAPLLTALGRSVASQRASLVLLEKVLVTADRGGRLRYFKSPRSYRRLTERMFASLSALRMASVAAEDVRRRDGVAGTTKGHDIALLLEAYAAELAERFPLARVNPDVLYVDCDGILTSAGTAACGVPSAKQERTGIGVTGRRVTEAAGTRRGAVAE
jgi:hypothetical protein